MSANIAAELPQWGNNRSGLKNMADLAIFFLAVAWPIVAMRVYVRFFLIRSFKSDDWLILASLGIFTAYCVCELRTRDAETNPDAIAALSEGIGPKLVILRDAFHWVIGLFGTYFSLQAVLKVSVGLTYLRILKFRRQRLAIIILLIVNLLYYTALTFVSVFACGNPANFVMAQIEGRCIDAHIVVYMSYVCAALSITTDWVFVGIPTTLVYKSHMPRVTKLTTGFLLSLGLLSSICSIVRIQYIRQLTIGPLFLERASAIACLSCVESGLGIIAISASTLRPLFVSIMGDSSGDLAPMPRPEQLQHVKDVGDRMDSLHLRYNPGVSLRKSDEGLSRLTTKPVITGPDKKDFEMDELDKKIEYFLEDVSLADSMETGSAIMNHENMYEQDLVTPWDGVRMATRVVITGGRSVK
ncbi:hypothetical protein MBLNU459_g4772t2 [Dothideomycetes sp. NU459]